MYGNKIYSLRYMYLNLPTAGLIKTYTRFHKFCYMKQMEWMVNDNRIGAKKIKYSNGLIFLFVLNLYMRFQAQFKKNTNIWNRFLQNFVILEILRFFNTNILVAIGKIKETIRIPIKMSNKWIITTFSYTLKQRIHM